MDDADLWRHWLADRHYSTANGAQRDAAMLRRFQRHVIDGANLDAGDTVLDLGAGDGLIAFGAVPKCGPRGTVIFTDVSRDLLSEALSLARRLGVRDHCRFLQAPAQDLGAVVDASVDAVTARSVLIYLDDSAKERSIAECHRVLRSGGRLSVLEPAHMFWADVPIDRQTCLGYDAAPIADLAAKVNDALGSPHDVWIDFESSELFSACLEAGFEDVQVDLSARRHVERRAEPWEAYLDSTPNPLARTLREAMDDALTAEERQRLTDHLRPRVESATEPRTAITAMVHLQATRS